MDIIAVLLSIEVRPVCWDSSAQLGTNRTEQPWAVFLAASMLPSLSTPNSAASSQFHDLNNEYEYRLEAAILVYLHILVAAAPARYRLGRHSHWTSTHHEQSTTTLYLHHGNHGGWGLALIMEDRIGWIDQVLV